MRLSLLVCLFAQTSAFMPRALSPKLWPKTSSISSAKYAETQRLATLPKARVNLLTADAAAASNKQPFWDGQRLHDYFNLGIIPGLIGLSVAGIRVPSWNAPLAICMFIYIALDGLWIAIQPHIVGSPSTLIGHHIATALICAHALANPLHTRYVSWLTIVEVNTFFLILKRHVEHPLFELAFKLSWLGIRVIWFPIVSVYFICFAGGWEAGLLNLIRRVLVCSCIGGLGFLQLQWTWSAVLAPLLNRGSSVKEEVAVQDETGKKGFL